MTDLAKKEFHPQTTTAHKAPEEQKKRFFLRSARCQAKNGVMWRKM